MKLDLNTVRAQFPALDRDAIFLDNPAGTQVARHTLDRMNEYLVQHNANRGGAFATAQQSDAVQYAPHGVTDVQDINCDFYARAVRKK